jgi:hypothetical protein
MVLTIETDVFPSEKAFPQKPWMAERIMILPVFFKYLLGDRNTC